MRPASTKTCDFGGWNTRVSVGSAAWNSFECADHVGIGELYKKTSYPPQFSRKQLQAIRCKFQNCGTKPHKLPLFPAAHFKYADQRRYACDYLLFGVGST